MVTKLSNDKSLVIISWGLVCSLNKRDEGEWNTTSRYTAVLNSDTVIEELGSSSNKITSISWKKYPFLCYLFQGKLIGICGSIGSGKSSLLSAILKQMYTINGKIERAGTIAYASQQAWIMNTTVKQNIVFNQPFDSKRYRKAVFACSLQPDFKIMTHGDRTEVSMIIRLSETYLWNSLCNTLHPTTWIKYKLYFKQKTNH